MFTLTQEELDAIKLSLRVSTLAMAASLPFGIAIAMVLTRTRFYGRMLLNALVLLPLVLPPVVTGYVLLLAVRKAGADRALSRRAVRYRARLPLDRRGLGLRHHGISAARAAPSSFRFEAVDRRLEQAASTLGANPLYVFSTVTLPLILPGIIAGGILCFARAMGEFGATITFVSNIPGETQTLPTLIYTFTQVPGGEPGALRLTLISVVISLGAILASEAFVARVQKRNRGDGA